VKLHPLTPQSWLTYGLIKNNNIIIKNQFSFNLISLAMEERNKEQCGAKSADVQHYFYAIWRITKNLRQ
jgi:hypothetical protein